MIEQDIISDVADIYCITVDNITSKRRIRRYVEARMVVSYLLCSMRGLTTTEVGDMLHCTHASVIYFRNKAKDWLKMPILNNMGVKAIRKLEKRYKTEDA